jgi:aminoglycoside/choline kinase family phosphotransferase
MLLTAYTVDDLTPARVTAMLRTAFGHITVDRVDASPVGAGQMANSYRLQLAYSDSADGAPASVIAKVSSADDASRQMAASTGAYIREVRFYQQLSSLIDTRAPKCYFAEIADDTLGFVLLLEDLGPARMLDQLGGCGVDEAALALGQAAALHGPSWGHASLRHADWLPVEAVWTALGQAIPHVTGPWLERFGGFLEPEHVSVVNQLGTHVDAWLTTLHDHRNLWHGDFRLDNLLFDAQGGDVAIAVVDWQSVAAAPGIIDVSYFLGNSMNESDRLTHERDLVAEYHQRILCYGVEGYSAEQCWREYQAHALYGLVLTIPVSLGVQQTERGDVMFAAMARRAADQILANESFSALAAI